MDITKNRLNFNKNLSVFVDSIKLTDNFLNKLKTHDYFSHYIDTIESLQTEREKVLYILTELTRERSTCRTIVQLLREDNQREIADQLAIYNESKGPNHLSSDIELEVTPTTAPKKELSNCYDLIAKKRGICVIINNVEEQQHPNIYDDRGLLVHKPNGMKNETKRFQWIFTQLFFEVIVLTKLSAVEIKERLTKISLENTSKKDQAFVLIVMSHGQNEKVLGYHACEALRKIHFGLIAGDDKEAVQEIGRDVVGIKELIAIFSEENCVNLRSKPKLHFYICCRVKDSNTMDKSCPLSESSEPQMTDSETMEVDGDDTLVKVNETKKLPGFARMDTFVTYACAEEFESYFDTNSGMSYFGQAFTHSIAQYACDEPLSGIMSRTSTRLKNIYREVKRIEEEELRLGLIKEMKVAIDCFAIEVSTYAMDKQLYFNPGRAE